MEPQRPPLGGRVAAGKKPTLERWLREQVTAAGVWSYRQQLRPGLETPGSVDPALEKLPKCGMPTDLKGARVLDVGCGEGFFSFEAERRGATEVVAIDTRPASVRRFDICRAALESKATAYLCSVYDLSVRTFGTFDLVLAYGLLNQLRHPLLGLEKIFAVCTGSVLLEASLYQDPAEEQVPLARLCRGPGAGQSESENDSSANQSEFWLPNYRFVQALMECSGFTVIDTLWKEKDSILLRATGESQSPGEAPDQMKAPWS